MRRHRITKRSGQRPGNSSSHWELLVLLCSHKKYSLPFVSVLEVIGGVTL